MTTLQDRVVWAFDRKKERDPKATKSSLARAAHIDPASVSDWFNGKTKSLRGEVAIRAAAYLGVSSLWLASGKGSRLDPGDSAVSAELEPGPDIRGKVPVISWVQAGDWNGANDPLPVGDAERWLECPVSHSDRTYALRVRGDSMTAPFGASRTYPEGCIIFVDPLLRSPVNGQRIIAKLEGSDEVTFKVFKHEDGRVWLQPLNPMHPAIFDPFKVLGTVIGKWEDE